MQRRRVAASSDHRPGAQALHDQGSQLRMCQQAADGFGAPDAVRRGRRQQATALEERVRGDPQRAGRQCRGIGRRGSVRRAGSQYCGDPVRRRHRIRIQRMRARIAGQVDGPRAEGVATAVTQPWQRARLDLVADADRVHQVSGWQVRRVLEDFIAVVVADALARTRCRQAPAFPTEQRIMYVHRRLVDVGGFVRGGALYEACFRHTVEHLAEALDRQVRQSLMQRRPAPGRVVPHLDAEPADDVFGMQLRRAAVVEIGLEVVLPRQPLLDAERLLRGGDGESAGTQCRRGRVDRIAVLLDLHQSWQRPQEPLGLERAAVGIERQHAEAVLVAQSQGALGPVAAGRRTHQVVAGTLAPHARTSTRAEIAVDGDACSQPMRLLQPRGIGNAQVDDQSQAPQQRRMIACHRTALVELRLRRRDRRHPCARRGAGLIAELRLRSLVVAATAMQLQRGALEPVLVAGHEPFHTGQRFAALDDAIQVLGHFRFVVDTASGLTLAFDVVVLIANDHSRHLLGQRMVLRAWRRGGIGVDRRHVQVARDVVHGARGETAPVAVFPARHGGRLDRRGWRKQGAPQRWVDRVEQGFAFDPAVLVEQFDCQPRACALGPIHEHAGLPQRAVGIGPDRRRKKQRHVEIAVRRCRIRQCTGDVVLGRHGITPRRRPSSR